MCILLFKMYFSLFSPPFSNQGFSFNQMLELLIIYSFKYFLCGPFLKSLLNLLQYCFCFWFFDREACGAFAPWPGIRPVPLCWRVVLTTEPSVQSPVFWINNSYFVLGRKGLFFFFNEDDQASWIVFDQRKGCIDFFFADVSKAARDKREGKGLDQHQS